MKLLLFLGLGFISCGVFSQSGSSTGDGDTMMFIVREIPAEFPGGFEKMNAYLNENKRKIVNPRLQSEYTEAEQREFERVIVQFELDTNGTILSLFVEKGLPNCTECNEEAIRLVQNMPNWIPAELNGKLIPNYCRLPFSFELEPEHSTQLDFLSCNLGMDAEFIGGDKKLTKYIQKNIRVPSNPRRKKNIPAEELLIGGRVVVLFVVEADGRVSYVELEEKLPHCEACNQEALRVVQNMPQWKPAIENGKKVSTCLRLPIYFEFN